MKPFLTLACWLCVSASAYAAEPVDLLAGKTVDDFGFFLLDGGVKSEVFRLEDGILKISGTPFGWLETPQEYKNFTLRCEIRHPNGAEKANSGLFLRITERNETCLPACIEVQMHKGSMGHLFGFHGHRVVGSPDRSAFIEPRNLSKVMHTHSAQDMAPEAWNTVEVTCFEDMITVRVNGQLVNWGHDVQNVAGKIGFQSEGGEVWYRNITLTEE